jgi:hypothetical protein
MTPPVTVREPLRHYYVHYALLDMWIGGGVSRDTSHLRVAQDPEIPTKNI